MGGGPKQSLNLMGGGGKRQLPSKTPIIFFSGTALTTLLCLEPKSTLCHDNVTVCIPSELGN